MKDNRSYEIYTTSQFETGSERAKRHRRWPIIILLCVLIIAAGWFLMGKQPVSKNWAGREKGSSTILIAGTDGDGYRTDTIMLLSVNSHDRSVKLLSIPRDTYTTGYKVPKINSVCGAAGGGREGMESLVNHVEELLGFRPDGYVMVNLEAFVDIVDTMGGVDFEVPMEMHYSDPTQGLKIDLNAGYQHLNGEQSIQLVRFRSGYAMADLKRVEVQRSFVKSAIRQWIQPQNIFKADKVLNIMKENTITDLSVSNMVWLGKTLLICGFDEIEDNTLPGAPDNSGAYYVADTAKVAELMKSYKP